MKKFLFALCALALALPVAAADANNIKMVTYFPVPYAAYGDLGVTGTCDVGLMGQCALDAGEGLTVAKAASDSRALNTGSIIVRKGTLGLTPQTSVALGTQLTAGSGTGTGVLEFSHDLAVTSINSSRLAKARAMNEAQMTSLNMYGHAFPKCDESGNEISWKKLTLGKKSGVFLVCGTPDKIENPCTSDARTYWNASAQRCECPNANEYFHNGACCSSSTPKTDTRCWSKNTTNLAWQSLAPVSYTSSYRTNQSAQCTLRGNDYGTTAGWDLSNVGVPSGLPSCSSLGAGSTSGSGLLPSVGGGACTQEGQRCISSCTATCDPTLTNLPTNGPAKSCTFAVQWMQCTKVNSTAYSALWDTSKDTRYSCGHTLTWKPGISGGNLVTGGTVEKIDGVVTLP